MAAPNKPSPSAETHPLAVLIRLVPVVVASGASAALGFHLLGLVPGWRSAFLLILFLGLFLALIILDQEPGWNLVLLQGFCVSAGALLHWSGWEAARWETWLTMLCLTTAALTGALVLGPLLGKSIFPLSGLYTLVWVGFVCFDLPGWIQVWGISLCRGLITMIAAGVLGKGILLSGEGSLIPLASKLVVMLINMVWLCGWIPRAG